MKFVVSAICLIFALIHVEIKAQEFYEEDEPVLYYEEEPEQAVYRVRRQLFGGRTNGPGRSFQEKVGFQHGNTWGSLSQSADQRGRMSPITYSGGSGFNLPGGHSITGSIDHVPKFGSQASVRGTANLFSNDKHQLSAFAQHDRTLGRNWKPIGPETNSAGINYENSNGASAFLSGSKMPGSPSRGSAGVSIPIGKMGPVNIEASGQTNFGHKMKPEHQVGLSASTSF